MPLRAGARPGLRGPCPLPRLLRPTAPPRTLHDPRPTRAPTRRHAPPVAPAPVSLRPGAGQHPFRRCCRCRHHCRHLPPSRPRPRYISGTPCAAAAAAAAATHRPTEGPCPCLPTPGLEPYGTPSAAAAAASQPQAHRRHLNTLQAKAPLTISGRQPALQVTTRCVSVVFAAAGRPLPTARRAWGPDA